MKTSDFDYYLPPELIAQTPIEPRDWSRLLVLNRKDSSIEHRHFADVVDYLRDGDVLVLNNTRVIPARLTGIKTESGGKLEILLLQRLSTNVWEAIMKRSKRVRAGAKIEISDGAKTNTGVIAEVLEDRGNGIKVLGFSDEKSLLKLGEIALPPYVHVPLSDSERYQTIYSDVDGSVAAPTAGLHFTRQIMSKIKEKGVRCLFVTLHVGLDTFQPVREEDPQEHAIHQEYGVISQAVADELSSVKREGRRVICVGTTSVRLVEAAVTAGNPLDIKPFEGWIDLFILPGYQFKMTDAMITNFHLPRTTLMMLVTAFAGKDLIDKAYQEAITQRYRFYSFGDAMLVL